MAQRSTQRLYRSPVEKMLGGVCGGLGEYFDVDPVLMRLGFVALTFLSGGTMLLLYVVLWIVVPKQGADEAARAARWRENADEIVGEARRFGGDVRDAIRPRRAGGAEAQPATGEAVPFESESGAGSTLGSEPVAGEGPVSDAGTDPAPAHAYLTTMPDAVERSRRRQNWAGLLLILVGVWLLANNLNLFWWVRQELFWPLVLLGAGAWLLFRQRERTS